MTQRRSQRTMSLAGKELAAGRHARSQARLDWCLHQLRKDGKPSGMSDARTLHATEEEARGRALELQTLNPSRDLHFALLRRRPAGHFPSRALEVL